jgi:hypothetical protein
MFAEYGIDGAGMVHGRINVHTHVARYRDVEEQ